MSIIIRHFPKYFASCENNWQVLQDSLSLFKVG